MTRPETWDVFYSERLELAKGLTADEIRSGLLSGLIQEGDLVRPSGTNTPWSRITEIPELSASPPRAESDSDVSFPVLRDVPPTPAVKKPEASIWGWADDDEDEVDEQDVEFEEVADELRQIPPAPTSKAPESGKPNPAITRDANHDIRDDRVLDFEGRDRDALSEREASSELHVRTVDDREASDEDEEEDDGVISLARSGPKTVEELDLAAMVDVAFQLVLFFLVTATTILYKTLEIPKPSTESPPDAVAQGRNRTLDDLQDDYIVVEIDAEGNVSIDREPVAARLDDLAERLRSSREKTNRTTMLLSADFSTPHRSAVLAYDAANEIGLRIAIARPRPPEGPPPALRPRTIPAKGGA